MSRKNKLFNLPEYSFLIDLLLYPTFQQSWHLYACKRKKHTSIVTKLPSLEVICIVEEIQRIPVFLVDSRMQDKFAKGLDSRVTVICEPSNTISAIQINSIRVPLNLTQSGPKRVDFTSWTDLLLLL